MGLVDDQQVELPGVRVLCRQDLADPAHVLLALQEVDRGDQAWEMRPRVDPHTATAAQVLPVCGRFSHRNAQ